MKGRALIGEAGGKTPERLAEERKEMAVGEASPEGDSSRTLGRSSESIIRMVSNGSLHERKEEVV